MLVLVTSVVGSNPTLRTLIIQTLKHITVLEEEIDMLFLLEHFSLEDLVEAENKYEDAIVSDSENLADYQYDDEQEDEYANTSDTDLGDYDEDGNYYLWD